jgi:nucleoside-diphosphate-sugar epimerase
VHRLDVAHLYRLALEKGSGGSRYQVVAEEGIPFRSIAEVIGKRLDVPVVSLSHEETAAHFGWFAHFAAMERALQNQTSSGAFPCPVFVVESRSDEDGPARPQA